MSRGGIYQVCQISKHISKPVRKTDLSAIICITMTVNGHRKQPRVTEYQQNCFLCLAFIDAR